MSQKQCAPFVKTCFWIWLSTIAGTIRVSTQSSTSNSLGVSFLSPFVLAREVVREFDLASFFFNSGTPSSIDSEGFIGEFESDQVR